MSTVSFGTFVTTPMYMNIPRFDPSFISAVESQMQDKPALEIETNESGDPSRAAIYALYQLYLIAHGGHPNTQMQLEQETKLHITFVGDNVSQRNMFFQELDFQMHESLYFKQFCEAYDVTFGNNIIAIPDLNIVIDCSEEDAASLRGSLRVLAVRGNSSNDGVSKSLTVSLTTVRHFSKTHNLPFTGTLLTFN